MAEQVKRRYDSSGRQAAGRAARRQVVDAATSLFVDGGYVGTSIEAIAATAEVPIATVYRHFGSKIGILKAVLEVAFVGDDEPLSLHERGEVRAAAAEPDPRALLAGFARVTRVVLERSGRLHQVLRTAASADPAAADLLAEIHRQRLTGQTRVAKMLHDRGALRDDLSVKAAADVVYTLLSPDVHRLMVEERRWSADRYESWLARTLCEALLS